MPGLSAAGFETLSLAELKVLVEGDLKEAFGAGIDVDPQSNFGQLIVLAERFADLWSLGAAIDGAFNPDSATGAALDNLAALTGTIRNPATYGTVTLTLTGTTGNTVPAGSAASVPGQGARWVTDAGALLAPIVAWDVVTPYNVGDRRSNGSTLRSYQCITAGNSAASGGPTTTSSDITDGTCHWKYLGEGGLVVDVAATCDTIGAALGVARTISVIETPFSGWSSVTNLLDADVGQLEETDAALRLRREAELRGPGRASVESIRAALLEVDGVTEATVLENATDATVDGITPHAIEAMVRDGADAAIRAALFAEVAAGIATVGTTSGTVTDSQGTVHTVKFTRPTEVDIYIGLTITVDERYFSTTGADQAEALIVAWGNAQRTGKNVVASGIEAQVFALDGVLEVEALISTSASPTVRTTIQISQRQLAVYDTGRITTAVVPGTP